MKRFLPIAAAFFLMLASVGCVQDNETNELTGTNEQEKTTYEIAESRSWTDLDFTSLEELVESHKAVREGKAAGDLAAIAERESFLELDKLYAPSVIPKGYYLFKIEVNKARVTFIYYPENDMFIGSYEIREQVFLLVFFHQSTMDDTLQHYNATEEDLIDGKYFFLEPNHLCWELDGVDGVFFGLTMPLPLLEKLPDEQKKIEEMIKYAEVKAVELGG